MRNNQFEIFSIRHQIGEWTQNRQRIKNSVLVISCFVINYPSALWLKQPFYFHNNANLFSFCEDISFLLHFTLTEVAQMELEDPLPKLVHWYDWQVDSGWIIRLHLSLGLSLSSFAWSLPVWVNKLFTAWGSQGDYTYYLLACFS